MSRTTAAVWARVAHDLRQPIQSMQLLTHIMTLSADLDQRKKSARAMEASFEALLVMIDDLSRLGKLEVGQEKRNPSTFALADLLTIVADRQRSHLAETAKRCVVRSQRVSVTADRRLLEKLLTGMLVNASKFSQGDEIVVSCHPGADGAHVEIEFDGPPMTDSVATANFIEQRRGSGLDAVSQTSTGLGVLSQLAHLLDWTLSIQSLSPARQRFDLLIPDLHDFISAK